VFTEVFSVLGQSRRKIPLARPMARLTSKAIFSKLTQ